MEELKILTAFKVLTLFEVMVKTFMLLYRFFLFFKSFQIFWDKNIQWALFTDKHKQISLSAYYNLIFQHWILCPSKYWHVLFFQKSSGFPKITICHIFILRKINICATCISVFIWLCNPSHNCECAVWITCYGRKEWRKWMSLQK